MTLEPSELEPYTQSSFYQFLLSIGVYFPPGGLLKNLAQIFFWARLFDKAHFFWKLFTLMFLDTTALSYKSKIFHDEKMAVEYLLEQQIIQEERTCDCGARSIIKSRNGARGEIFFYRCISNSCRKRKSLYLGAKIELHRLLFVYFLFLLGMKNKDIAILSEISEITISKIRKKLIGLMKIILERNSMIGGIGVEVQVDETAILHRRRVVRNPSSEPDNLDTVWLLGGIESGNGNDDIFIKIIPDRSINTLSRVLDSHIRVGSVLVTDGLSSYPRTANNLTLEHHVVNHTIGFVNEQGWHTNKIEGSWAHLKQKMREGHGYDRNNIENFVSYFVFLRKYIKKNDNSSRKQALNMILRELFD